LRAGSTTHSAMQPSWLMMPSTDLRAGAVGNRQQCKVDCRPCTKRLHKLYACSFCSAACCKEHAACLSHAIHLKAACKGGSTRRQLTCQGRGCVGRQR
jgi:hypothetical protein